MPRDVRLSEDAAVSMRTLRRSALTALLAVWVLACAASSADAAARPSWTTYHRDAARTGDDPDGAEPIAPVFSWQSVDLGAPMWSQPLVLGSRVYVATVGDEVYSLDAATGEIVWKASAGTPVPAGKIECGDVDPTIGIVGTPVIDPLTETLYAVADTWDAVHEEAHHLLVGFRLSDGEEVLSTPVDPPGANPKKLLERPALNLSGGRVVFGFGGNAGDCGSYDGVVGSAPETGGAPSFWRYEPAAPSIGGAAVWAPSGAAVDGEGNVYVGTGNPNPKGASFETFDYSDSLLELSSGMSLLGYFEPPSWKKNSAGDEDLGSAGPTLLPGGLLFQAGKSTIGYLIEQAGMAGGDAAVYSEAVCKVLKKEGEGSFGGDAYADGTIYVPCVDGVRALSYEQAKRAFSPLWHGPADANGPPIVSSGSVWVVATGPFLEGGGQKLYGLDPATGAVRYTLTLPSHVVDHFASPSAAGGRLFLATGSTVTAYQVAQLPSEPAGEGGGETPTSIGTTKTTPPPSPAPGRVGVLAAAPTPARLLSSSLYAAGAKIDLRIACRRSSGACTGSIAIRATVSSGGRKRRLLVASGTFAIAHGHTTTLRLRLSPPARRLLARRATLHTVATITGRDPGTEELPATAPLTIKRRR